MYGAAAYSLAVRIVRDRDLAADVVQNVFLAVWTGATQFDPGRGQPSTWIMTMTHHKAVDMVRREQRRRTEPLDVVGDDTATGAPVEEQAWRGVAREHVRAALARLPDPHREVIELAYFAGYTQSELADAAGASHRHRQEPHVRRHAGAARHAGGGRHASGGRVEHVDELIAGQALYALSDEDSERVALHVAECERVPRQLREAEAIAASLAYAVPTLAPPPDLRERVLAAVEPVVSAPPAAPRPRRRPRRAEAPLSGWLVAAVSRSSRCRSWPPR